MKLKNFLMIMFLLSFGLILVACNSTEPTIIVDAEFDITVGDKVTLNADVIGLKEFELTYTSGDSSIASVSDNGVITALKVGNTTITIGIKDNEEVKTEFPVVVKHKVALDDFAPTAIAITGPAELGLNTSGKLNAAITPAAANKGLAWVSEDAEIVTVLSDGTILARGYGSVKITATSTIDETVKGEHTVKVVAQGTDQEVVDSAIEYLIAQLPEYVTGSFTFPTHPNPDVVVEWKNFAGQVRTQFDFAAIRDGSENVSVNVTYKTKEASQNITLKLVVNLENNLHAKLPYAVAAVNAYMDAVGENITNDLMLYTDVDGVKITWASDETGVIENDGTFIRPDNDTNVKLTANFGHSGASRLITYDVVAVGYSDEEKVDYIKENTLKPYMNLETASNVSLPKVDEKFGATITWVSNNLDVANHDGSYVNVDLEENTSVIYTVTISYDVEGFDFEETLEVEITYTPLSDIGKAVILFLQSEFELPEQVVYGNSDIPGQLTDLPTSQGDVTIEWYGKEGEFDEEMNVLIPRITYTPTEIYAKFSKEGFTSAVIAFPINIGILTGSDDEFAFTERTTAYTGESHNQKDGMPAEEGGVGTVYALGFESFYFKSTFERTVGEEVITKTWYFFFVMENSKVIATEHLKDVEGKKFVDKSKTDAIIAPKWGSASRIFINGTDETVYVHKDDIVALGAQAGSAAYLPFVIDAEGEVTIKTTPAMSFAPEGFTEYEIPSGGMLVLPGYIQAALNPNLHTFGEILGTKIDVIQLTGWEEYAAPTPAA